MDGDLAIDSEGQRQSDLPAESRGLLPAGSEGDCRRDFEGGLRTGLRSDSQGETLRRGIIKRCGKRESGVYDSM